MIISEVYFTLMHRWAHVNMHELINGSGHLFKIFKWTGISEKKLHSLFEEY